MSTSIVLGSQHDAARCFTLAPTAAIDRYLPPTPGVAAKQLHVAAAIDRRDRQTDGRTDGRTHRRSALEASGANKSRVSVCIQTDNGAVVAVVAADAGARVGVDEVVWKPTAMASIT